MVRVLLIAAMALQLAGCASIVSKKNWPVTFNSSPEGAHIVVKNQSGQVLYDGTAPTTLKLRAGAGFFKGASYTVEANKEGYGTSQATLHADLNGWYIGNLFFGGLIGFLIIDPATGKMYRLDENCIVTLPENKAAALGVQPGELRVASLDELPAEYHAHLVPIE